MRSKWTLEWMCKYQHRWLVGLGLPATFLIQILFFSQLHLDWWLEDDPNLFVLVSQVTQPLDFFWVRELASVNGHYFTPLQLLSFWVDQQLRAASAGLAYGHTLMSFFAAQVLLFLCLRKVMGTIPALAAAILWIFLPTTIAVTEWISARHYLEGLVLLMTAWLAAEKGTREGVSNGWVWCWLAMVCFFASALAKELYVVSGWWLLTCLFWWRNAKYWIPILSLFLALYFVYRFWAVDAFEAVDQLPLNLNQLWILPKLPFVFSGNPGGYGLFAAVGGFAVYHMHRGKIGVRQMFFWVSQWGLALATIFPVAGHLSEQYQTHGSWYRLGFLLNTLLLAGGVWIVSRTPKLKVNPALFSMALICLLMGAWVTTRQWDERKSISETEGRFYLEHSDRLLYSRTPGNWFLAGLHNLYTPDQPVHFIGHRQSGPNVFLRLKRFDEVWELGIAGIRVNPSLHRILWINGVLKRNPLHLPVDGLDGSFAPHMTIPRDPASAMVIEGTTLFVNPTGYQRAMEPRGVSLPLADRHQLVVLENNSDAWGLVVANPSAGNHQFRLRGFDGEGAVLEVVALTLEAGQKEVATLVDCFKKSNTRRLRRIELQGTAPSIACLFQRVSQGDYEIHGPVPHHQRQSFNFAHIPSGANWSSELIFFNGGRTKNRVTLRFFKGEGNQPEEFLEVQPGEVRNYQFKGEPHSAVIEARDLGLMVWQRIHMTGEGSGSFFQPLQDAASRLWLPPAKAEDAWRALVLFNENDRDCQVVLRAILDEDGWERTVKAGSKLMLVLPPEKALRTDRMLEATAPLSGLLISQELRGRLNTVELQAASP